MVSRLFRWVVILFVSREASTIDLREEVIARIRERGTYSMYKVTGQW